LIKNIPIHDDWSLELRGEAFNVLNKAAFSMPNATVGSSNFGYITSQSNSPRNIQLSAKGSLLAWLRNEERKGG